MEGKRENRSSWLPKGGVRAMILITLATLERHKWASVARVTLPLKAISNLLSSSKFSPKERGVRAMIPVTLVTVMTLEGLNNGRVPQVSHYL